MFRMMNQLKIGVSYLITFPHTNFSSVYTLLRSHDPVQRHDPLYTFLDKYGNKVCFTNGVFQQMTVVEWVVVKAETEQMKMMEEEAATHIAVPILPQVQRQAAQRRSSFPELPYCANPMRLLPSQHRHFSLPSPPPITLAEYIKDKSPPAYNTVVDMSDDELYS